MNSEKQMKFLTHKSNLDNNGSSITHESFKKHRSMILENPKLKNLIEKLVSKKGRNRIRIDEMVENQEEQENAYAKNSHHVRAKGVIKCTHPKKSAE